MADRAGEIKLASAISSVFAMLGCIFACFQNGYFCWSILRFILGLALTAQTLCDDC